MRMYLSYTMGWSDGQASDNLEDNLRGMHTHNTDTGMLLNWDVIRNADTDDFSYSIRLMQVCYYIAGWFVTLLQVYLYLGEH